MPQSDSHMTADPARRVYELSPWAHGYIHGYEQGFHFGDMDLQMAHPARNVKEIKEFRKDNYEKNFGDRTSWTSGYRAGFRIGYSDAFNGQEFRAIQLMRNLASDLPESAANGGAIVDTAVSKGYSDGRKHGLEDGRNSADYRPDGADCELSLRFKAAPAPYYCSVYALGYRLGYADGFLNQKPESPERQKKIAGAN